MERRLDPIRAFSDPDLAEYSRKAQRDLVLLLEGKMPPGGEDYGVWTALMTLLLKTFEQEGPYGLHDQIITRLDERTDGMQVLLSGAMRYGRYWSDVIWDAEERRSPTERERTAAKHRAIVRREQAAEERRPEVRVEKISGMILHALQKRDLSRTEIYALFSRNASKEEISKALEYNEVREWIRRKSVPSGGRPGTVQWFV